VADTATPTGNQMRVSDFKTWIDALGAYAGQGIVSVKPFMEAYDSIYGD
jgi:hypothetical protein